MNRKSIWLFGILLTLLLAGTVMWSMTGDGMAISCSHSADGVQSAATSSYVANNGAELREIAAAQKQIQDCSKLTKSFEVLIDASANITTVTLDAGLGITIA
jgi:hypothetical protein